MRFFSLINARGQELNLTVKEDGLKGDFLHGVSGLGYSDIVEYKRVGNIYKRLLDYKDQATIKGTVHFFSDRYRPQKRYFDLVQFLQLKPLTLVYAPYQEFKTYYRTGTVTDVEYSENEPLSAEITFTATTLWYERYNIIKEPSTDIENGKTYNYTYNYKYSDTEVNSIGFNVDTHEASPIKLTISGEMVNPEWHHYIDGQEVSSGKLNYTIREGYKLVIDTTDIPYTIKEYDDLGNFVIDLYNYSDFGTQRFLVANYGYNVISVNDDNGNESTIKVEAMVNYASV